MNTYDSLVTEARGLLGKRKQARARLIALTVEALADGQITQRQWAADTGADPTTVSNWVRYHRETQALGPDAPDYETWYRANRRDNGDRAFSAARGMDPGRKAELAAELLADPDVAVRLEDRDEARMLADPEYAAAFRSYIGEDVSAEPEPPTPDQVRAAMRDPEVAAHVTADPDADQAISQARHDRHMAGVEDRLRDLDRRQPEAAAANERIGQAGAKLDLEDALTRWRAECRRFADQVAAALPKAGTYGGSDGPLSLAANVTSAGADMQLAGNTLAALRAYTGGGAGLDEVLAQIVGGSGE